jgi:hypothetical protein
MKSGVALGQFWPFRRLVSDMDSSDHGGTLASANAAPHMDSAARTSEKGKHA